MSLPSPTTATSDLSDSSSGVSSSPNPMRRLPLPRFSLPRVRQAARGALPVSDELLAERQAETRDAELIVAIFRTIVLLGVLLGPRLLNQSTTYEVREVWLAGVAGVYNIMTGLSCLRPSRYGLRRPFIVTMDMLLITLWIQISLQWELRPFYYVVVVVAAMWFRVFGGVLVATFCNFFFFYLWFRAYAEAPQTEPFRLSMSMLVNSAMLFLVGCLVGFIAEAQEKERERRLEDQLLIANYQHEIDISAQMHPALLTDLNAVYHTDSKNLPHLDPHLDIGAAMQTARQLGGGDYFDLIPLPDGRLGLCIADVSGKSVRAQARLPLLKYSLRALAPLYAQPNKLIERLNETLTPDLQPELYIALCYIVLDFRRQTLSWCNAGHIEPLLFAPADNAATDEDAEPVTVTRLDTLGPALGMFPDISYDAHNLPWHPDSMLLLFTDGLVDAFSYDGSEDGEAQVRQLAGRYAAPDSEGTAKAAGEAAQELVDLAVSILDETSPLERSLAALRSTPDLEEQASSKHRDDITVLIARHTH